MVCGITIRQLKQPTGRKKEAMEGTGFHSLALIAAALFVAWAMDWGYRFWRRRNEVRHRDRSDALLRSHGMEVHTYLPSFGAEAGELRDALAAFDFTNKVVLDRDGRMVGRLLPSVRPGVGRMLPRGRSEPTLRLVIDNTK